MPEDDVQLMLAFKRGDYNAFSALVDRHQLALTQYFFSFTGDRQKAEDLSQEAWRKIFRSRAAYEPRAAFKTFLFRVARNLWIDSYRSKKSHPAEVALDRAVVGRGGEASTSLAQLLPGDEETPLEALAKREIKDLIEAALERLSKTHRDVFVLAEFQGLKYAEIGEILEIPVGTVKSRMFNAVRRLRELLEKDLEDF
ncbi:MAG: sigma-70 family RNA polymerase sigma factor [Planctomycetota bacterium]